MPDRITLRPATAADVETLAHLWTITFPDKFGPILGERAENIICDWLRLSQRHLHTSTIGEVNGAVAGFISLETPSAPGVDSGRWLWRAVQLHNGIIGALRSFILMVLIDSNHQPSNEEVYIEMLGVDPDWRGRGLAGRLLEHAEAVAAAENVDKLTLNVVSDNVAAITLYKKYDFYLKSEQSSRILKWITGYDSYQEMEKKLR